MKEIQIQCPACGQDILCDRMFVGTQLACPGCHATLKVPEETAEATAVSVPAGDPPTLTGSMATSAQQTSRLAIASLVCSLLSFVTCLGWLPGIICGHMAKSRIRRDPSLTGNGLATAGLVIAYLKAISHSGPRPSGMATLKSVPRPECYWTFIVWKNPLKANILKSIPLTAPTPSSASE